MLLYSDIYSHTEEHFPMPDTPRKYADISEFGHSMHHLIDKLRGQLHDYMDEKDHSSWDGFGFQLGMHHLKRERRALRNEDERGITERDRKVFEFALYAVQGLMANTYSRHWMGILDADEIYPVNK